MNKRAREATKLYKSGLSINGVAGRLGVSASKAYSILIDAGVKMRPSGLRVDAQPALNERNAKIIALYRDGLTLKEIGDMTGITRERVRQILKRARVKARPRKQTIAILKARGKWGWWFSRGPNDETKKQWAKISEMRASGLSMSEIGAKLGVSRNAIAGQFHRLHKHEATR